MKIDPAKIPGRIVLSRKGSDSTWGGRPSLRIRDELISLPIPEHSRRQRECHQNHHARYQDLPLHLQVGSLHSYLSVESDDCVHLDPDIRAWLRPTLESQAETRLLFGQEGTSQSHLLNQGVCLEDPNAELDTLFLFFGWFKEATIAASRATYMGSDRHIIWGWFQVARSFPLDSRDDLQTVAWAAHHPHVLNGKEYLAVRRKQPNRLYVARERTSFAPQMAGAGCFTWTQNHELTQGCTANVNRSDWCVPEFLLKTGLTYNTPKKSHCSKKNGNIHFRSAPIGQEFVFPRDRALILEEKKKVAAWLELIFGSQRP